jgi:hypothetical protein
MNSLVRNFSGNREYPKCGIVSRYFVCKQALAWAGFQRPRRKVAGEGEFRASSDRLFILVGHSSNFDPLLTGSIVPRADTAGGTYPDAEGTSARAGEEPAWVKLRDPFQRVIAAGVAIAGEIAHELSTRKAAVRDGVCRRSLRRATGRVRNSLWRAGR